MSRKSLTALGLLGIATAVVAAPKPPTGASFDPEFAYSYVGANYVDIRLANRAGTAAVLVNRSTSGGTLDVSPPVAGQPNRIVYGADRKLWYRTWSKDAGQPVVISSPTLIFSGGSTSESPDVSPDGKRVAFVTDAFDAFPTIALYDFAPTDGSLPNPRAIISGYSVYSVRWSPSGNALYFLGSLGNNQRAQIWRLDMTTPGASPTLFFESVGASFNLDISHPQADPSKDLLVFDEYGGGMNFVSLNPAVAPYVVREESWGTSAHFNCSNTQVISQVYGSGRGDRTVNITTLLSGAVEIWAKDANIRHADWIVRSPCL